MQLWQWVILMASHNHIHWDFDKEEATENSKCFQFSSGQAGLVNGSEGVWQIRWAWCTFLSPLSHPARGMDNISLPVT